MIKVSPLLGEISLINVMNDYIAKSVFKEITYSFNKGRFTFRIVNQSKIQSQRTTIYKYKLNTIEFLA